jgi:hypothetical protein
MSAMLFGLVVVLGLVLLGPLQPAGPFSGPGREPSDPRALREGLQGAWGVFLRPGLLQDGCRRVLFMQSYTFSMRAKGRVG